MLNLKIISIVKYAHRVAMSNLEPFSLRTLTPIDILYNVSCICSSFPTECKTVKQFTALKFNKHI